uniref:Uncharacterized protein n=1 Tax=Lutzomyia longipalpis TaxID=7200 RepID=A0A1B0CFY9_LUTLO
MALVAYEFSTDEEDNGSEEGEEAVQVLPKKKEIPNGIPAKEQNQQNNRNPEVPGSSKDVENGQEISDEEDEAPRSSSSRESELQFNLPAPSRTTKLPIPEEDDEFLRIKATPTEKPPPKRGPVKITIPSLSQFKDLDDTEAPVKKPAKKSTGCGLLDILPKPLSETLFQTSKNPTPESRKKQTLVPDSVMNRHTKPKIPAKAAKAPKAQQVQENDDESDGSDAGDDFFRLNTTEELPEVSKNELNVLIAKKAAQIAATSSRFEKEAEIPVETMQEEQK